jgi:NAD(P)-dependent dehydrogenase (short-subunit alcohol dehydrogenase family)
VSSGIGEATMHDLVAAGFTVFGTIRRGKDAARVESAGATPIIMDVTYRSSVTRAYETVTRMLGNRPLRGLVNNAGTPGLGPIELLDLEELRRTFEVNVFGAIGVTQVFLPLLRASQGRVVNISSVSARLALPFAGSYAASKFALEGFSDSLRRELAGTGVAVVVIQPGSIRTAIWEKIAAFDIGRAKDTIYQRPLERIRSMALRSGEKGLPPEAVARSVRRALTSRRPPTRILVVSGSKWRQKLVRLLPDSWIDRMIVRRLAAGEEEEERREK